MNLFIRKNNKVTGPFPLKQLQQSILLGRLALNDEVSKDRQEWVAVRSVPELIPDVLKGDVTDPLTKERIAAARRWADERRGERRDEAESNRAGPGRREPETNGTLKHRQQREANIRNTKMSQERLVGAGLVVVLILVAAGYLGIRYIPTTDAGAQCEAAPAKGVNWDSCNFVGLQAIKVNLSQAQLNGTNLLNANLFGSNFVEANIAYANFTQANLSFAEMQRAQAKGANFSQADLTNANLSSADLSYANFKQAKLLNTILTAAVLDNAIWTDGKICQVGSLGKCITH